ncbi:hypothetical protein JCM10296v2_004189 [Rhodotorula toruloides]
MHAQEQLQRAYDGLERSNTTNSFKSFFFGSRPAQNTSAPVRRPLRKERRTNRPKTTHPAIDPHFPTLPYLRPDPSCPAPLRQSKLLLVDRYARDDRIAAWQERRMEEVGRLEKWRTQVAKEVAWEKAIMEDGRVGAAVEELEGMLDASAFSTSFTVDSLRLPPSPEGPPTPPPKNPLPAPPATFLELDEVDDARSSAHRTTLVLDTTIELPPPPVTPKTFTPPASAVLAPVWSVLPPAPSPYRFPAPPSPNYPNLIRINTSFDTPPPISVSAPPPECSIVPPKAAALLGLLATTTVAGKTPANVPIVHAAHNPSSTRPPLRRLDSVGDDNRKYSMETPSASLQTGASIFSAHATAPVVSRPSCSSSSAPTSANASSSWASRRQAPPGLSSLKLRKEGISSLPDLHSAGLSAILHKSIYPAPPKAWQNWRYDDGEERESLINEFDFACSGEGLGGERIGSTRATRNNSVSGPAGDVQLRVATVIRQVSFRSLRGGKMLVRALSKSKSGGNLRKTATGRIVVEDEQEEQRWKDLRKEWEAERDDLEGMLSRRCCI